MSHPHAITPGIESHKEGQNQGVFRTLQMVLLCAEGLQSKEVATGLGVHEHAVGKWRRFVEDGIDGLTDEYRAGRPRTVSDAQVAQVIERTLNTTPNDATHRSIRSIAGEIGLSHTTIRRI